MKQPRPSTKRGVAALFIRKKISTFAEALGRQLEKSARVVIAIRAGSLNRPRG